MLAYYLVPKKVQWPLLLVASYVFYWCASPWYLLFIGVTTVSTYAVSRLLERVNDTQKAYLAAHKAELDKEAKKAYKAKMKAKKWHLLLLCLIFNLGILSVTKYTNFVITNINAFLSGTSKLALVDMIVPLGKSRIAGLSFMLHFRFFLCCYKAYAISCLITASQSLASMIFGTG